jgi:signal transduction histidine kinase
LDQFAYVVSHDLKAPLRGMYNIFNWIDEDHKEEISGQLEKYMKMMKGRIHRMESLITGLLEYARIGRGMKPIEKVNLKELIDEVVDMVVTPKFKVIINNEIASDIRTDKLSLQQVFTNLISNAVKYNGGDAGTITIGCFEKDTFYEFSVSDNGVGISPEYHSKIFGIFQTLREKNEIESTGVGLAIVKKIIEEKKGAIHVVSQEGKGATFTFSWPKIMVYEPKLLED